VRVESKEIRAENEGVSKTESK